MKPRDVVGHPRATEKEKLAVILIHNHTDNIKKLIHLLIHYEKKILILLIFIFAKFAIAQQFETFYVRGKNSTFCGEEKITFNFFKKSFEKIDSSDGKKINGPSKKVESNYNDSRNFYEIKTSDFVLDEQGIDEYRKYYHFSHKIGYDKKGGNVLYVYQTNNDQSAEEKYFFT